MDDSTQSLMTKTASELSSSRVVALKDEAMRLYVDCCYSGAGHHKESDRWRKWDRVLGVPSAAMTAVFAAVATISAVADSPVWITGGASALAAGLAAIKGYIQTHELAEGHSRKANRFLALKNEARLFLFISLKSNEGMPQLAFRLEQLRSRYNELLIDSPPRVSQKSYEQAKAGINSGEMSYEDDPLWKEISNAIIS